MSDLVGPAAAGGVIFDLLYDLQLFARSIGTEERFKLRFPYPGCYVRVVNYFSTFVAIAIMSEYAS